MNRSRHRRRRMVSLLLHDKLIPMHRKELFAFSVQCNLKLLLEDEVSWRMASGLYST